MVLVGWQQVPSPVTKSVVLRDLAASGLGGTRGWGVEWRGEQRQGTPQVGKKSWNALGDPPFGFFEAPFSHVAKTSLIHTV